MERFVDIIRVHRSQHTHVLIEVVVADDEQLMEMVKPSRVDMVITREQKSSKDLVRLFAEQLMVVMSAPHPSAGRKELELLQLDKQAFSERVKC